MVNRSRKVISIHQIEITSRCNLRCRYCVHPHMGRSKEDMTTEVFTRSLEMVHHCYVKYGQVELNLCGIGESTMHPQFEEFVAMARKALPRIKLVVATNGILLDEKKAAMMRRYKVMTWISLHRPEKAGPAVEIAKKYGILFGVSNDPSTAAINWAGKVDWHVSASKTVPCPWLTVGTAMICADGSITTCCLDGEGDGIIGTIEDDIDTLRVEPYSLCDSCHHVVPSEMRVVAA